MDALLPYINEDVKKDQEGISSINWPEWIMVEGKIFTAKEALTKILDSAEHFNMSPLAAFKCIDQDNEDYIDVLSFRMTLEKLCPKITIDELYYSH